MSYILEAKLKMYGQTELEDYFVDFYFNMEHVQAFYMSSENLISIVISGQIYELEYNRSLYTIIKKYFTPISLN